MQLRSFVVGGALLCTPVVVGLLYFLCRDASAAPEKPEYPSSPVIDRFRSAFWDPRLEAWFCQPVVEWVVSKNESCIVEEVGWAYEIDRVKDEIVKKVEPTDEEISRSPSKGALYLFLQRKLCVRGRDSLSEVETDLFNRLTNEINETQ